MNDLEKWRQQIDTVDEKILNLLARRANLVRKIGRYKKENNISVFDGKRWGNVLAANLNKAKSLGLPKDFVKKIFTLIHKYSLKVQK